VTEDRSAPRAEVADREERLRHTGKACTGPASQAEFLAIGAALVQCGCLRLHLGSIDDAKDKLSPETEFRQLFVGFQRYLYERTLAA
jgi:hypothetical protein